MPIRQDTLRLRWLSANNYAASTKRTYTETLSNFQRRHPLYAERVTHEHLVDYLTTDADGSPTRRAPGTLERQRSTLRSFWRWTHRNGYLRRDPSEGLEELVLGSGQRRPGRWLTRDDAHVLLSACQDGTDQGRRDHALILVGLLTGLRRSELAGLRWRQLDLSQGRATVVGKGSSFATIGLPDQVQAELRLWRSRVGALRARKSLPPDSPVFPTGRPQGGLNNSVQEYAFDWSRPLTPWGVRALVARRAEVAGIGTVATHDLRRSFAGFLDHDGIDLKGIQAALRHSSPGVTARCYLDRSPRRAVEAVADLRL